MLFKYLKLYKGGAIILAAAFVLGLIVTLGYYKTESKRLSGNQSILLSTIKSYKVADSLNAATIGTLSFKISEVKRDRQVVSDAGQAGINYKDLQAYSSSATESSNNISGKAKDTIIRPPDTVHDTRYIDTCKVINYRSKWFDLSGLICGNNYNFNSVNRDSLVSMDIRKHKKFLGIRLPKIFGLKAEEFTIYSKNPHTKILFVNYIKIDK